jgi:diadenosine tetraphosphatase ApaH/serine/threonine PP2A family protein phosphatase
VHDLEPFRDDQTGHGLRATGVRLEGDDHGRFLTELTSHPYQLLARRRAEDRVVEHRRATHQSRIVEDQLQTVVVGEVMTGRQTELTGAPGDDVPVPPGPFGKPDVPVRPGVPGAGQGAVRSVGACH